MRVFSVPKIVDREKLKQEIALSAAHIFLDKGYKSLGMRELSSMLGMSKSALYHYYKTKDDLFNASLKALLKEDTLLMDLNTEIDDSDVDTKCKNFEALFFQVEPRFMKELSLVQEYIKIIGQDKVHSDEVMLYARMQYLELIKRVVDDKYSDELYTLLYGLLMRKLLEGERFPKHQIKELARTILQN